MTKVQQISDVNEVIAKWSRLTALEPLANPEAMLQVFLRCLDHGAVFFVYGDRGLMGACCVENCQEFVNLLSLPRDNGVGMAKDCLEKVYEYAKEEGIDEIRVTSTNLCGSSFRYFEKSLGFRRQAVIFKRML